MITANREYLSEVDVPLATATTASIWPRVSPIAGARSKAGSWTLAEALDELTLSLMEGIGGSMGPLYGSLFIGMADEVGKRKTSMPPPSLTCCAAG